MGRAKTAISSKFKQSGMRTSTLENTLFKDIAPDLPSYQKRVTLPLFWRKNRFGRRFFSFIDESVYKPMFFLSVAQIYCAEI